MIYMLSHYLSVVIVPTKTANTGVFMLSLQTKRAQWFNEINHYEGYESFTTSNIWTIISRKFAKRGIEFMKKPIRCLEPKQYVKCCLNAAVVQFPVEISEKSIRRMIQISYSQTLRFPKSVSMQFLYIITENGKYSISESITFSRFHSIMMLKRNMVRIMDIEQETKYVSRTQITEDRYGIIENMKRQFSIIGDVVFSQFLHPNHREFVCVLSFHLESHREQSTESNIIEMARILEMHFNDYYPDRYRVTKQLDIEGIFGKISKMYVFSVFVGSQYVWCSAQCVVICESVERYVQ